MGGGDRKLPPKATVDLSSVSRHSFTQKVKDKCPRCRGTGGFQGLLCDACKGTGVDELGLADMVKKDITSVKSGANHGGLGDSMSKGSSGGIIPIADSNVGGAGTVNKACCVLS